MKLRNLTLALAATGMAVGGIALPTVASASRLVPSVSSVGLHMVEPSALSGFNGGSFEIQLVANNPIDVCAFYLYRYTDEYGSQYLGDYSGTSTDDLAQNDWGDTYYYMYPTDCSGNEGNIAYSGEFYPYVWSEAFSGESGSWGYVDNSKFYAGQSLELFSKNSEALWETDDDWNIAVDIATGPTGGIGTVYVNGANLGTINFYSKKAGYKKLEFKDGWSSPQSNTVQVRMTGKGSKGGYDGWLDAGTELINA
jgi:hypothetical protein